MTMGIDALLDQKMCPATRLRQLSRRVTCNPRLKNEFHHHQNSKCQFHLNVKYL
jgi:hypothetical protein